MTSRFKSQKGAGDADVFWGIIMAFLAIKVGEWILGLLGMFVAGILAS